MALLFHFRTNRREQQAPEDGSGGVGSAAGAYVKGVSERVCSHIATVNRTLSLALVLTGSALRKSMRVVSHIGTATSLFSGHGSISPPGSLFKSRLHCGECGEMMQLLML